MTDHLWTDEQPDEDAPAPPAVDIAGMGKPDLLIALYNHAVRNAPNGMFGPLDMREAQARVDHCIDNDMPLYFGAVMGKQLRVDLTGDLFDPTEYDEAYGMGAAAAAVAALAEGPAEHE